MKLPNKKYIIYTLAVILVVALIAGSRVQPIQEPFWNWDSNIDAEQKHKTAFCLLTTKPSKIWLDFLLPFTNHFDIFIAIDNQHDYPALKKRYPEYRLIQVSDEECTTQKYTNSDYMFKKPVVATDRAFCYFNRINTGYDYIWFCEDDVFIPNIDMINALQSRYPSADLIVPKVEQNKTGANDGWPHWDQIRDIIPLPWAHGLVCLTRISKRLMEKVDEFVKSHGKLIYKEVLFHTIAIQDNTMRIVTPAEMSKIVWIRDDKGKVRTWDAAEVQKNPRYIYHPIKDLQKHVALHRVTDPVGDAAGDTTNESM